MYGTCYADSECRNKGGVIDGNCAAGFGVCCTFTDSTCGSTVTQNCTYITNPNYPTTYSTAGSCAWSVTPLNSEICQIRLDFDNFDITEDATTGACTDSLTMAGGSGKNPMDLCGTLTGMHVYIENARLSTSTTLTFTIATGGTWKTKVTQIECYNSNRANPDCNQWITGTGGTIQSYNWPTIQLRGKTHTTCIRREKGYCGFALSMYTPGTTPDSFQLETAAPAKNGVLGVYAMGWLYIEGNDLGQKWGGGVLSPTAGAAGNAMMIATGGTVQFEAEQFIITHNTLAADGTGVETGYKLSYEQIPCGGT